MRICFVLPSSFLGGSEKCSLESVKALYERGWEIYAVFPREGPLVKAMTPYCKKTTIIFYEWWMTEEKLSLLRKLKFLYRCIESSFKISRFIEVNAVDKIITSTLAFPQGAIAAFLSKRKHYWYIHEFGKEDHGFIFIFGKWLTLKIMNMLSHKVIVNSKIIYNHFLNYFKEKATIVYYAVETPEIMFKSNFFEKEINIVMLGRLAPGKRQEDIIKALPILKAKGYNIRLKLIGHDDSPYVKFLKNLQLDLELSDEVEFIPFTPDPFREVEESDILVVCSILEAFGRVTVEGMKAGKVVIASNTGASPEIINHAWNGLLYECKNSADLAAKIEMVINDKALQKSIANNGYNWSKENFSLQKHGKDLSLVLEN